MVLHGYRREVVAQCMRLPQISAPRNASGSRSFGGKRNQKAIKDLNVFGEEDIQRRGHTLVHCSAERRRRGQWGSVCLDKPMLAIRTNMAVTQTQCRPVIEQGGGGHFCWKDLHAYARPSTQSVTWGGPMKLMGGGYEIDGGGL